MRELGLLAIGVLFAGLPAFLICARFARLARARRLRESALRGALQARLWSDQLHERGPLAELDGLRQRNHEANNALSTALLSAQFLSSAAEGAAGRAKPGTDLSSAADELVDALQRLKALVGQARTLSTTPGPSSPLVVAVPLLENVEAAAARARGEYPRTAIEVVVASAGLHSARVNVCAGGDGFARALGALLRNACEGDGTRAASRVVLRLGAEAEVDAVSLEVADDGPGMTERELHRLVQPFQSTKPGHVGLGLYTARCILEASGGSVNCQNDPGRGMRLTLFLPAALEASAPPIEPRV